MAREELVQTLRAARDLSDAALKALLETDAYDEELYAAADAVRREGGLTVLDLASGAIGASHVTSPGNWRNEAVLTDDVLAACREAVDRILAGEFEGLEDAA